MKTALEHLSNAIHPASQRRAFLATTLLVLLFLFCSPFDGNIGLSKWRIGSLATEEIEHSFHWRDVTPSKHLVYTQCYNDFQCARLDVPLNWNTSDLDNGLRAAIALVKVPAQVPVTDAAYGGAILVNPGGPGESGVHQVLSGGKHIQTILGTNFDIIGFDPRGVNNTTPWLKCFPDPFNQQAWVLKYPDYGLLWDSESVLGLEWARAKALGASCEASGGDEGILRYLNTAQVVEDMVAIIERHGEWCEIEAKKSQLVESFERTKWKKGGEKIQYWGFSYGSLLGQTFAAMHPDRVGRLVIDGVLDPEDYYQGKWLKNLQDSDQIIAKFCDYCYEAGPEKCALFAGSSGRDVEARLEKIMASLKSDPVAVPSDGTRGPEIVTFGDMFLYMLTAMYFPYPQAERFFEMLAEVEARNGTRVAMTKQQYLQPNKLSPKCQRDGAFSEACTSGNYVSGIGALQAISCMDCGGGTSLTKEEFGQYLTELKTQGKWISTSWARNKLACVGYTVSSAWSFEGPIAGNTSHPLLIIGNTHDTVTPISNARRVSTLFPGSAVLHHESEGHCSFSNPSICTGKVLRKYFQTGELPENETICNPEFKPFVGCLSKNSDGDCEEVEDEEMWRAMETLITEMWP